MTKKLKEGEKITWTELSDLFVKKQGLPHGTKFELIHKNLHAGTERKARMSQKKFTLGKFQGRAADEETLHNFIWNRFASSLIDPPSNEKYIIRIKGPNGESTKGPTSLVRRLRKDWVGLPTQEEIEAQEQEEREIDEIASLFNLADLKYCRDSAHLVLRGVMRRLFDQHSQEDIQLALDEEAARRSGMQ